MSAEKKEEVGNGLPTDFNVGPIIDAYLDRQEGDEGVDLSDEAHQKVLEAGQARPKGGKKGVPKRKVVNLEAEAKKGVSMTVAKPYDPEVEDKYPNLWQYLSMAEYSDGTPRLLPTVTLNRVPGGYVVSLQDHEMMRQCRCEASTLSSVWEVLEVSIVVPTNWTYYKSRVNRKGAAFSLKPKETGQAKAK
jgi:hypothetical protein